MYFIFLFANKELKYQNSLFMLSYSVLTFFLFFFNFWTACLSLLVWVREFLSIWNFSISYSEMETKQAVMPSWMLASWATVSLNTGHFWEHQTFTILNQLHGFSWNKVCCLKYYHSPVNMHYTFVKRSNPSLCHIIKDPIKCNDNIRAARKSQASEILLFASSRWWLLRVDILRHVC